MNVLEFNFINYQNERMRKLTCVYADWFSAVQVIPKDSCHGVARRVYCEQSLVVWRTGFMGNPSQFGGFQAGTFIAAFHY